MASVQRTERVIEPYRGLSFPDRHEVWDHRDLIYHLARRDVAVRYKQSVIGAAWAILQPIALAGVFSVFFGLLQKVDGLEDIPYPAVRCDGDGDVAVLLGRGTGRIGEHRQQQRPDLEGLLPSDRHPDGRGDPPGRRLRDRLRGRASRSRSPMASFRRCRSCWCRSWRRWLC